MKKAQFVAIAAGCLFLSNISPADSGSATGSSAAANSGLARKVNRLAGDLNTLTRKHNALVALVLQTDVTIRQSFGITTSVGNGFTSGQALCDSGAQVVGGGAQWSGAVNGSETLLESGPASTVGWRAYGYSNHYNFLKITAICLSQN